MHNGMPWPMDSEEPTFHLFSWDHSYLVAPRNGENIIFVSRVQFLSARSIVGERLNGSLILGAFGEYWYAANFQEEENVLLCAFKRDCSIRSYSVA